jgi:ATP-binding cassette subfamily B protein
MTRRKLLAPEVIQTSAMDCGPATLKTLLEGFGVRVSYGRLREACQTDVDGTSIDVMEEVARDLGLDAEQVMLPLDHLFAKETGALPAILVVRNPDGFTHFIVVWRRIGPFVQVMDPASGRRWVRARDLLQRTFTHAMPVAPDAWREWAASETFLATLRARMRRLRAGSSGEGLIVRATEDASWRSLATLDAATRLTEALVTSGALDTGPEAARMLAATEKEALREIAEGKRTDLSIPTAFWSAAPLPPSADGEEQVLLRGAVLVGVRGKRAEAVGAEATEDPRPAPSAELLAALREPPRRPLAELLQMLRRDGLLGPTLIAGATLTAALAAAVEALVLRGLFGVAIHLPTWEMRLGTMLALAAFSAIALGIELPIAAMTLRTGRRLELRLREAFFAKIPRLNDRYFSSRPTSDMSHRAHSIDVVRSIPLLGFRILRCTADVLVDSLGLIWIDRRSLPYVVVAAVTCVVVPFAAQKALNERDARVRSFNGALTRFYLDALRGLVPLRTHGAGRALRTEHESMLGELRRAFMGLLSLSTSIDALTGFVSAVMTVGLLAQYLSRGGDPAGSLLLVYWALSLPASGVDLAAALRQYPQLRNATERALEPLGALEDDPAEARAASSEPPARAAHLRFVDVSIRAAGKTILEGVHLDIPAGSEIAIVGPSGAGKSSLCGLLLGWHRAAQGEVRVDGEPLRAEVLDRLRSQTAWVDPAIALWNRSLLDNVEYGTTDASTRVGAALEAAEVVRLLQQLPDGLQTRLGDGGALVSGGEGQRVRLARAMLRADSRLVILDEPFRGLDRETRRRLLERARQMWAGATLLCVTHDVGETLDFPRVLVIDEGRIVEDGSPRALAADPHSRYHALQHAEHSVRETLWRGRPWRRLELRAGVLTETHDEGLE